MHNYPFKLVDVFTDAPLEGNQLAVVFEADGLSDDRMQALAREFNYSETTFVLPPRNSKADWRLRSFTPTAEVFGAGHNALGAWWAIAESEIVSLKEGINDVYQELGERILPLEIFQNNGKPEKIMMRQSELVFGEVVKDKAGLAETLGLSENDLTIDSIEPQAVSTGAFHLIVPVKSLKTLENVRVNPAQLVEIARPTGCQGCYLFTLETIETDAAAHARAFFPGIGISEDAATGSAAGPLAAYLVSRGILPQNKSLIIEQGYQIGRPSRIEVLVSGNEVKVGGKSITVAEGTVKI